MAFIGLKVPHETARLLGQIKVEGEKVDLSEMHVTVLFLGSDLPIETIAKATQVAYEVTCRTKPFTVATKLVTSFPQNPDGIPVIARVESGALHVLRGALTAAFDAAGVPYDKKYPDYKPHVTLAYLRGAERAPPDMNLPSLEWGAGELVLWGGDRGDDKLTVTFPFALTPSKTATYRAFVRQAALLARLKEAGLGAIERKILQSAKENRGVYSVVVEHTKSTRRGGREFDAANGLVKKGLLETLGEPETEKETKGGWSKTYQLFNYKLTPAGLAALSSST